MVRDDGAGARSIELDTSIRELARDGGPARNAARAADGLLPQPAAALGEIYNEDAMSLTGAQRQDAPHERRQPGAGHAAMLRLQRMSARAARASRRGSATAAVWIASAAEFGLPAAQIAPRAHASRRARGVARPVNAALRWFPRAAEQRDAEAMNMIGRCHENGWGTPVDLGAAARHWYRPSAYRGHDWGQYNFANMLFDGRGVDQRSRRGVALVLCAPHDKDTPAR